MMSGAAQRRARVLDAARKLFCAKGFHGTGIAEVACVSGIKVGQIYRDFASKEAIVAAIVEADFAAAVDSASFQHAIETHNGVALIDEIEGMMARNLGRTLMPEILAEASRNHQVAEIVRALDARCKADLAHALEIFAPCSGASGRREEVAELIMTLAVGISQRSVATGCCANVSLPPIIRAVLLRELAALSG